MRKYLPEKNKPKHTDMWLMSQWAERQCGETCLNGNTEDYI